MKQISALLELWNNPERASSEVKKLANAHIAEQESKIREMQSMQRTLQNLAKNCHGNDRPDCPILEDLGITANNCH